MPEVQVIAAEPIAPPEPRGPAVLHDAMRDVVCSFTDAHVVEWAMLSALAADALSPREIAHARVLLAADPLTYAAAARYIRQQLRTGDHVQARARIAMTPGAVLPLGGRRYTVTGRRGALASIVVLRGERGGLAELHQPHAGDGRWWLYRGGLGRPNTKTEGYRRDDATGAFTAAK